MKSHREGIIAKWVFGSAGNDVVMASAMSSNLVLIVKVWTSSIKFGAT
jgi:glutathione synthase/RimK-type ligase-like ATP-grasp enzyme